LLIVVAWNMHRERRAWGHLLSRLTPDIALLQETTPRDEALAAGAVIAAPLRPTATHGSAVFVRGGRAHALEIAEEHRGWFVVAEVHFDDAPPLVAVSIHGRTVGLPGERVRPNIDRGFDALEPILRDRSFIVGGDLNLSRNYKSSDAEFLDALPSRGHVDCMRKFYAEEQRTNFGPRVKKIYQNDHLFVSADLADQVKSCAVADRAGISDHAPLRMVLDRLP
jgi:exonuclease III